MEQFFLFTMFVSLYGTAPRSWKIVEYLWGNPWMAVEVVLRRQMYLRTLQGQIQGGVTVSVLDPHPPIFLGGTQKLIA